MDDAPMRAIAPKTGTHCQLCGNLLLPPAVVVLSTRQMELLLQRTGVRVWKEPVCLSVRHNVDMSLGSVKVTAVKRGSWGRTDPACWLLGEMGISSVAFSFRILVEVIPRQNECLYTRQWRLGSVELSSIEKCWASMVWYNFWHTKKTHRLLFISATFDPVSANALLLLGLCFSTSSLHG